MWEDNDKMGLEEIGREGKVSICVAQEKNKWKDLDVFRPCTIV